MPNLNKIQYIFIHHTAVSYKQNPDQWKQTDDFHKERFGMQSSLGFWVGYNYEIAADGTVRQARQEGEETAAVKGYNFNSVSICLDGNFDIELPTPAQEKSLADLIVHVLVRHSVPLTNVLPHRWACGTPPYKSCYGNLLPDNWAQQLVVKAEGPFTPPVGKVD